MALGATERNDKLLLHLLLHAGRLVENRLRTTCEPAGVHHGQGRVLMLLAEGALTQQAIGARLDVRPATVTNMVQRMEAAGLVVRTRDPRDERVQCVALTPEGREAQMAVQAAWQELESEILAGLPRRSVGELHRLLRCVVEGLGGRLPEQDGPAGHEEEAE